MTSFYNQPNMTNKKILSKSKDKEHISKKKYEFATLMASMDLLFFLYSVYLQVTYLCQIKCDKTAY